MKTTFPNEQPSMIAADWWIRLRAKKHVKVPLNWGFSSHCYRVVQERLDHNFIHDLHPANWTQFTRALRLSDSGKTSRKRRARDPTTTVECLCIAAILGIDAGDLYPPPISWLEAAVVMLAEDKGIVVSASDARKFAHYVLIYFDRYKNDEVRLARLTLSEECLSGLESPGKVDGATPDFPSTLKKILQCLEE